MAVLLAQESLETSLTRLNDDAARSFSPKPARQTPSATAR